jgi:hypothetical protein
MFVATASVSGYRMTAGLRFTGSLIWVGVLNFNIQNFNQTPPNYNGAVQPILGIFGNSLVALGSINMYTFVMKIPPGAMGRTSLRIASNNTGVGLCGVSESFCTDCFNFLFIFLFI